MYKVLLVDDERLELNTLKNYVDWTKLGIGTVYTANNGLQALETAEFKKPDIVFTDIRMPVVLLHRKSLRIMECGILSIRIMQIISLEAFQM